MNKESWHEERRKGIGGSEIADVMNLEPWGCARKLWYDKRGMAPDYPMVDSPHMRRGREMESVIARIYIESNPIKIYSLTEPVAGVSKDYPYIRGNADRFIYPAHKNPKIKEPGILECKCPARNTFKTIQRDGLPYSWVLQLQEYLYVYDMGWGAYAILWAEGWEFITFEVQRDDEMIGLILDACHDFWRKVENGPAPVQLGMEDSRCKRCNRIQTCYGLEDIPLPEYEKDYQDGSKDMVLTTAYMDYKAADDIFKEAKEFKEEQAEILKTAMGERGKVQVAEGRIVYNAISSFRLDTKRLLASEPEVEKIAKNYMKESSYWALKIFPTAK